ncbi:MAG: MFS transporter [Acidimicrobiaceae bacterium]|jgi:MFS family permease|nr:MFS transporter [Acidimicrobiaceae bacterium]
MSGYIRERRVVSLAIIMSSAAVAQAFGRFTWGVVLPNARDDVLDGSNTLAGLFGSINVFAYLVGTILVAWLSSRLTLVWLVRVGLMMSTSGLALASFAPAPWVLGIALFIMGLGGAVIWVPAPGIAVRYFPTNRRGLASGIVGAGIGIGIVFAGRLAGWVDDGSDGAWQRVYRVELVLAVVVLVLVFTALKSGGERPATAGGFGGFGALRKVAAWKPMTLSYTAYGFSYILIISFLVARLEDDSGFSEERSALVFSVVGLAIIVGGITIVPLSDRIGRRFTLIVAFSSWAVASMLVLTGNTILVFVAAVMIGLMFSGIPGTIVAHVVSHTDETSYGPAFSAMTLAFGLAQAVSPQIGGAIADWRGSFTAVFLVAAGVALLGAIASARIPSR